MGLDFTLNPNAMPWHAGDRWEGGSDKNMDKDKGGGGQWVPGDDTCRYFPCLLSSLILPMIPLVFLS
jgi:hypothetical protein